MELELEIVGFLVHICYQDTKRYYCQDKKTTLINSVFLNDSSVGNSTRHGTISF